MFQRLFITIRYKWLEACNLGLLNALHMHFQRCRVWLAGSTEPYQVRSRYAAYPLWCRPGTTDLKVFYQIFVLREYCCLDHLDRPRLILDCGANVGYSSAYFLSRFPGARVIAVEPDKENFRLLERNLRPFGARVTALCAAVWSREASLVIEEGDSSGAWAFRVRECQPEERGSVKATTLDALFAATGEKAISLLKMDVEGAESTVFSADCRGWLPRTENIVIELHGKECSRIFSGAIAGHPFVLSRHGDLTVCLRALESVPSALT